MNLLVYFVVCAGVLALFLELYAVLLRRVAHLPRPLPLVLGLSLYIGVAGLLVLTLLGLNLVQGPPETVAELEPELALAGLLASWLVLLLWCRRRHLKSLRALGYFQR